MKKYLCITFLIGSLCQAQSLVQTINSGSIISGGTMASVGEIVVVSETATQSASGIIGILAQNNAMLEVASFEMSTEITAYPNPTTAAIFFNTKENLLGQKMAIYANDGKLVCEKVIDHANSLDLQGLPAGIYFIRATDKKLKSFKIIKH